jgi:hypothetical protein
MTYADMNRSDLLDQSSVHPSGQPSLAESRRIGCLECIIAALLEKNERMRQQLLQHMN